MKKRAGFLISHSKELFKMYKGKFIAVVNDQVVSVGDSRREVFHQAIEQFPKTKEVGVYYLPRAKEMVTALWIIRT